MGMCAGGKDVAVTVVIPTYNAETMISQTLDSLAAQTFRDFETIVVDDGSTDQTSHVVERRYPWVTLLRQKNAGCAAARNKAIAMAHGKWIGFLDADDAWLPWRLELELAFAEEFPEVVMWCGDFVDIDSPEPPAPDVQFEPPVDCRGRGVVTPGATAETKPSVSFLGLSDFAVSNPVGTTSVLLSRDVFTQSGGFDTQFWRSSDYECWIRVAAEGVVGKIEYPVARYRVSCGSLCNDHRKFLPQVLSVIDKAYGTTGALRGLGRKQEARARQLGHVSWMAYQNGKRLAAIHLLLRSFLAAPFLSGLKGRRRMERVRCLARYLLGGK